MLRLQRTQSTGCLFGLKPWMVLIQPWAENQVPLPQPQDTSTAWALGNVLGHGRWDSFIAFLTARQEKAGSQQGGHQGPIMVWEIHPKIVVMSDDLCLCRQKKNWADVALTHTVLVAMMAGLDDVYVLGFFPTLLVLNFPLPLCSLLSSACPSFNRIFSALKHFSTTWSESSPKNTVGESGELWKSIKCLPGAENFLLMTLVFKKLSSILLLPRALSFMVTINWLEVALFQYSISQQAARDWGRWDSEDHILRSFFSISLRLLLGQRAELYRNKASFRNLSHCNSRNSNVLNSKASKRKCLSSKH